MIIQSESKAIRMFRWFTVNIPSLCAWTNKQGQLFTGTRRIIEIFCLQQITPWIHFVKVHGKMKNNKAISNPSKWFSRNHALLHSHSHHSYSNLNHPLQNQSSENYSIFSIMTSRNDSGFQRFKTEIGSSIIKQQVSLDIGNSNMLNGYLHRYRK